MTLSKSLLNAIEGTDFVQRASNSIACAMEPFGCNGQIAPERIQVELADGTVAGLCANYLLHGRIAKEAGAGSEPQMLFTFLIQAFQIANPARVKGDKSPINRWVQQPVEAAPAKRGRRTAVVTA